MSSPRDEELLGCIDHVFNEERSKQETNKELEELARKCAEATGADVSFTPLGSADKVTIQACDNLLNEGELLE